MRKGPEVPALKDVEMIRDIQRLKAEMLASRAVLDLSERQAELENSKSECNRIEEAWQQSLAAPVLLIEINRSWSSELLRQEARVRSDTVELEKARTRVELCAQELQAATMRKDKAGELVHRAVKAANAHRDDIRMADAMDRHAARRGRS